MFTKIPVIDIAPLIAHGPNLKHASVLNCITNIHKACRDVGFLSLQNHNVPYDLCQETLLLAKKFFDQPLEEKNKIHMSKFNGFRGYQKLGDNVTQQKRDYHEGIDIYCPTSNEKHYPLNTVQPWPTNIPNFQSTYTQYVDSMKNLGKIMMQSIALSLRLNHNYFESYLNDSFYYFRILYYPFVEDIIKAHNVIDDNSLGCGVHQDYGCLTFINQINDVKGCLQVQNTNSEWITIDPIPNTLVVNLGDMLHLWSNGLYQSTPHRVLQPYKKLNQVDNRNVNGRISIPFFYEPNWDTIIKPIDLMNETNKQTLDMLPWDKVDTQKINIMKKQNFQPVQYGEHLKSKVLNNFY